MPRFDPNQRLTPSLLDRLIDQELDQPGSAHGYDHRQMIDVVRRDLEDLLNTRLTNTAVPEAFVETRHSIVMYGLPDLSSISADTDEQRSEVGHIIEDIIQRFEPRLRNVHAHLAGSTSSGSQTLRFQIHAELNVDPAEIGFETILELMTGHASIKESAI